MYHLTKRINRIKILDGVDDLENGWMVVCYVNGRLSISPNNFVPFILFLQIILGLNDSCGIRFHPPTSSDDLCLPFCLILIHIWQGASQVYRESWPYLQKSFCRRTTSSSITSRPSSTRRWTSSGNNEWNRYCRLKAHDVATIRNNVFHPVWTRFPPKFSFSCQQRANTAFKRSENKRKYSSHMIFIDSHWSEYSTIW